LDKIRSNPATSVTVDLERQVVTVDGAEEKFEINQYKKTCLMNGYDDIDYLLSLNKEVRAFDLAHAS
jgi:3-isopropylmalate/(R)-2-methylmalate dehydratase small subunit